MTILHEARGKSFPSCMMRVETVQLVMLGAAATVAYLGAAAFLRQIARAALLLWASA